MLDALRNAFRVSEVRNKLLLTGFILVVYQFAIHVPVIGVDRAALQSVLSGPGRRLCGGVEPAFGRGGE